MARKARLQKWAAVLLLLGMLISCFGGLSASAAAAKEITLTTNSDINPFLRVPLYARTFGSGGPFTVRCEMKIDSFTRTKSDGNIFVNIADGRDSSQMVVWQNTWTRKTDGWIEMTDENGRYITFDNIDKVLISGALEDFGLLQFGVYYGDAVVHFRNFRILNAAGSVVYSWDDDSSLETGNDVRDLSTNTLYGETFGDGSAEYMIEESDGGEAPATTPPTAPPTTSPVTDPDPTDPPSTQAPAAETTTSAEPGDTTTGGESGPTDTSSSPESTASSPSEETPVGGLTTQGTQPSSGGLGAGAIAGIVIGAVVILAGGAFGVLFALKKLPWMKKDSGAAPPSDGPDGE